MRLTRKILLCAALVGALVAWSPAQYTGGVYRNGQWAGPNGGNSDAYQRGWKDGQDDARHGKQSSSRPERYHNDTDRQAYDQGYAQGYQQWVSQNNGNGRVYAPNGSWQGRHGRDCDRDDPCWGNNGAYPNGGYYGNGGNGAEVAHQFGFQDGLREGQSDRASGHSFRPTQDTGYRLATNGYQAQFGSRDQYKEWYRSAYERGYQEGYNGGGPGYGRERH